MWHIAHLQLMGDYTIYAGTAETWENNATMDKEHKYDIV